MSEAEVAASRLEALADDERFGLRRDELLSLAVELRGSSASGATWEGVDLLAAFTPDATVTTSTRAPAYERYLGLGAAASVFLPVAWTWYSFHSATAAYRRLLDNGGGGSKTFLELWVTGFGGELASWHGLVFTAMISVLLIVAAIGLVLAHRVAVGRSMHDEDVAMQRASHELVVALTKAQRVLAGRSVQDPNALESLVRRSVDNLLRAHDKTREAATKLDDASVKLGAVIEAVGTDLEATTQQTQQVAAQAAAAGLAVQQATAGLESTVARTAQSLETSVNGASSGLSAAVGQSIAQLDQSLQDRMAALGSELSRVVGRSSTTAQQTVDRLSGYVDLIGQAEQSIADTLDKASHGQAASLTAITQAVQETRDALADIELALVRHESSLQGQVSELTATRDAAERMLNALVALARPQQQSSGAP